MRTGMSGKPCCKADREIHAHAATCSLIGQAVSGGCYLMVFAQWCLLSDRCGRVKPVISYAPRIGVKNGSTCSFQGGLTLILPPGSDRVGCHPRGTENIRSNANWKEHGRLVLGCNSLKIQLVCVSRSCIFLLFACSNPMHSVVERPFLWPDRYHVVESLMPSSYFCALH